MTQICYGMNEFKKIKDTCQLVDLTGQRFGMLVVTGFAYRVVKPYRNGRQTCAYWNCLCDCGNIKAVRGSHLKDGSTVSCGCHKKKLNATLGERLKTASHLHPRLAKVWRQMNSRCSNPKNHAYKDYGGRGIKVCDEWKNSLESFMTWALENGYDENAERYKCTIDRINNNGNYEPTNCRWVDMKVQNNNRRDNVKNRVKQV